MRAGEGPAESEACYRPELQAERGGKSECPGAARWEEALRDEGRVMDIVSRGGAFLAEWMLANKSENPLYEHFDDILKIAMSRTPMARPADPAEMVGAIIYLASGASSYVTGQVIAIDGGATI